MHMSAEVQIADIMYLFFTLIDVLVLDILYVVFIQKVALQCSAVGIF